MYLFSDWLGYSSEVHFPHDGGVSVKPLVLLLRKCSLWDAQSPWNENIRELIAKLSLTSKVPWPHSSDKLHWLLIASLFSKIFWFCSTDISKKNSDFLKGYFPKLVFEVCPDPEGFFPIVSFPVSPRQTNRPIAVSFSDIGIFPMTFHQSFSGFEDDVKLELYILLQNKSVSSTGRDSELTLNLASLR